LTGWLKQLQNEVIKFVFPGVCIGCGKFSDFICIDCARKLPRLLPPLCQKCGKPEPSAQYCPECWKKQSGIDGIRSVFIFEGIIRTAIHELKYYNLRSISGLLGEYMASYYTENNMGGDFILAVPLHAGRFRERGYNQSELLAEKLSVLTGVPVLNGAVARVIDNKPQARTVSIEERRRNVEDVFKCEDGSVYGKEVIIVDDVCTSGATLEACAKALTKAGAKRIFGFTLAREVINRS
jgi:competence protein ComFC